MKKSIKILYEDDRYVVFDKPTKLLVIPTPKKETNTLMHLVNAQIPKDDHSWNLHPCHRLDRDTSGTIIFAKGKRNQQMMMEEFKRRRIRKSYIAFVQGHIKPSYGEIRKSVVGLEKRKFRPHAAKKFAITRYKLLKRKKNYSIVEVEPVTGRTNQIRIHFSQWGYPLLGERKYAFARDYLVKFSRVALHAQSLEWIDPIRHHKIKVMSNLPKDMEVFSARN